jgi:hypothetical protein
MAMIVRLRFALLALLALSGCSDKDKANPTPVDSGIPEEDAGPRVTVTGSVIDYDKKTPLQGVTVTQGDATAVTAKDGTYTLRPLANVPLGVSFVKDLYTKLTLAETALSGDFDRGVTPSVLAETFHFVGGTLAGYDASLGVLYVVLHAGGTCTDIAGTEIEVVSPPGAAVTYFYHGIPRASLTAVSAGENPAAVAFNVKVGEPVELKLTHPSCKQVAFPHVEGVVTYTGKVSTEGGDTNSVVDYFLE